MTLGEKILAVLLLLGGGSGIPVLVRWLIGLVLSHKKAAALPAAPTTQVVVNTAKPSVPPISDDQERQRKSAREAGVPLGETGDWLRKNSLGCMRCDGHEPVLQHIAAAVATADAALATVEAVRLAAGAAASAAALASTGAMHLEEEVRKEGDETRRSIKELTDAIGNVREWKGEIGARVTTLEREMGSVRRGGSAAQ